MLYSALILQKTSWYIPRWQLMISNWIPFLRCTFSRRCPEVEFVDLLKRLDTLLMMLCCISIMVNKVKGAVYKWEIFIFSFSVIPFVFSCACEGSWKTFGSSRTTEPDIRLMFGDANKNIVSRLLFSYLDLISKQTVVCCDLQDHDQVNWILDTWWTSILWEPVAGNQW